MPATSVIAALTTDIAQHATPDGPSDPTFSTLRTSIGSQEVNATLSRTNLGAPSLQNNVYIRLAAAHSASTLAFNGHGTASHTNGFHTQLAASQLTLPQEVPTNRTIHTWNATAGAGSVRYILTTVAEDLSLFRSCWNVDIGGYVGMSCSRHRIADGSYVGMDASHDVGGTILSHRTTFDEASPRSILYCVRSTYDRESSEVESRGFHMFQYAYPILFRDRNVLWNFAGTSEEDYFGHSSTQLGGGRVEESFVGLRHAAAFIHRANLVDSYFHSGGRDGYGFEERCLPSSGG